MLHVWKSQKTCNININNMCNATDLWMKGQKFLSVQNADGPLLFSKPKMILII